MTGARSFHSRRVVAGGLAVSLLLLLAAGTPQGRATADQFLAQFRGDRLTAVSLSTSQIANVQQTLSDLQHFGTVSGLDTGPEPYAASIAEASQAVGFPVLMPDPASLPAGLSQTPAEPWVIPARQVRFTFDLGQARAYEQSLGQDDVTLPERFDGAALVVNVPAAVLLRYPSDEPSAGSPSPFGFGLVVGEAGTLTADAEGGVSLDELRELLLGLPGLAPETVRQLRAIDDWQTTLPVPIPVEQISWERATIDGSPGLLLDDNSGVGSAAIWQQDGRTFGIAGAIKARELQRVAATFH